MSQETHTQSDDLIYWRNAPWYKRFWHHIIFGTSILTGDLIAPSVLPAKSLFIKPISITMSQLAKFLDLDVEEYHDILIVHDKRYMGYIKKLISFRMFFGFSLYMILFMAFVFVVLKYGFYSIELLSVVTLLSILYIVTIGLFVLSTGSRIASTLTDKPYADTLAIFQSLNLLIEIRENEKLDLPHERKKLKSRIQALCRAVVLLGYQYDNKDVRENRKAYEHFKGMERYIREREGWLAMPKEDSLEIFRQDLVALVQIFISGNYGEFQPTVIDEPMEAPKPLVQRIWGGLLKFIGIGIPVSVLALVYVDPTVFEARGVDSNTVVLIAIAWLLLTLDAYLKLGVVERITSLAKTIRDLG